MTAAQLALLGRMVESGSVVRRSGYARNGWETQRPTEGFTYGSRKVAASVIEALERLGYVSGEVERSGFSKLETWTCTPAGKLAWSTHYKKPGEKSTNLPCHGCGSTDRHTAGALCDTCIKALQAGHQAQDVAERAEGIPVLIGKPNLSYSISNHRPTNHRAALQEVILELQVLLSRQNTAAPYPHSRVEEELRLFPEYETQSSSHTLKHAFMDPEAAFLMHKLHDRVTAAVDAAHKQGHEKGHTLIRGLAEGSMTLDDYQDNLTKTGAR